MAEAPMTVVETEEFLRKAKTLMSDAEREELVTAALPADRLSEKREGESHPGRAQRHQAVGADPGGGLSGEEVGGRDEHEYQDQATG